MGCVAGIDLVIAGVGQRDPRGGVVGVKRQRFFAVLDRPLEILRTAAQACEVPGLEVKVVSFDVLAP